MCQHIAAAADQALPWLSLAGLLGPAAACTCSDMQLAHVGCDCDAEQNLPVGCACGAFCRTAQEISTRTCSSCRSIAELDDPADAIF